MLAMGVVGVTMGVGVGGGEGVDRGGRMIMTMVMVVVMVMTKIMAQGYLSYLCKVVLWQPFLSIAYLFFRNSFMVHSYTIFDT